MNKTTAAAIGAVYLITEAISPFLILYILRNHHSLDVAATWVFLSSLIPIAPLVISGYGALITREVAKSTSSDSLEPILSKDLLRRAISIFIKSTVFIAGLVLLIVLYHCMNRDYELAAVVALFSIVIFARAYMNFIFAYFIGLGKYAVDKAVMLFCSVTSLAFIYIAATLFTELVYIVGVYSIPYIGGAGIVGYIFRKIKINESGQNLSEKIIKAKEIFKMYVINFAGFLTLNTDLYVAKAYFDNMTFVEVGIVSKAALGIISASSIVVTIQLASYSSLYASRNIGKLLRYVKFTSAIISTFTLFVGVVFIIMYDYIVRMITSQDTELSILAVALWVIFALIAVNIMNIGTAIISTGDSNLVKFAFPVAVIGLTTAIVGASFQGATGLILGMTICSALSLVIHVKLFQRIVRK